MAKINYNQILDLTLKVLLKETPNSHIEYNNLFMKKSVLENLSNRDKRAVLEKLIKDGYVSKMEMSMEAINNYYITLEGILFINSGGYKYKRTKERINFVWNVTKNVFLVFGTLSAFCLAVLQINQLLRDTKTTTECKALQVIEISSHKTTPIKDSVPNEERIPIQKK